MEFGFFDGGDDGEHIGVGLVENYKIFVNAGRKSLLKEEHRVIRYRKLPETTWAWSYFAGGGVIIWAK